MPDEVVVRPAADRDVPAILEVLLGGSRDPSAEDPTAPERYVEAISRIRAASGDVLVAEVGGEVVGVCQVSVIEHLQHAGGRVAEFESVHVAASHRNRGVGATLIAAALEWAQDRGCYRAQLTSHESRLDAHRFYARCGFVDSHAGFKRVLGGPDRSS